MKKVETESNNNTILGMSKLNFIILAAVAALIVVVLVLVVVDGTLGGHVNITNKTDKNISDIQITFKDELTGLTVDNLYQGSVASQDKVKFGYDGYYDFSNMYGVCYINVTFENGKSMLIHDGEFTSTFKGNFDLDFYQEDGMYYLSTKGYEGIFKTTGTSHMNSLIIVEPESGYWEYEDYIGWEEDELDDLMYEDVSDFE